MTISCCTHAAASELFHVPLLVVIRPRQLRTKDTLNVTCHLFVFADREVSIRNSITNKTSSWLGPVTTRWSKELNATYESH